MSQKKLSVAIVGAGMGGLVAAATLRQVGIDVQVYEQTGRRRTRKRRRSDAPSRRT